jgi:hypothetical protein
MLHLSIFPGWVARNLLIKHIISFSINGITGKKYNTATSLYYFRDKF